MLYVVIRLLYRLLYGLLDQQQLVVCVIILPCNGMGLYFRVRRCAASFEALDESTAETLLEDLSVEFGNKRVHSGVFGVIDSKLSKSNFWLSITKVDDSFVEANEDRVATASLVANGLPISLFHAMLEIVSCSF